MQLGMFLGHNLISVEKEMRRDTKADDEAANVEGGLFPTQIEELTKFMKDKLVGKVANVKVTTKLDAHPCVITVEEMAAARHFIKTQSHQLTEENRYALLQPQLEINPK
jgi:TNF receptor-associated protein 1